MKEIALVLLGVVLGWVTKIPFFIKFYKEEQRTREEIRMINKSIDDRISELKNLESKIRMK